MALRRLITVQISKMKVTANPSVEAAILFVKKSDPPTAKNSTR